MNAQLPSWSQLGNQLTGVPNYATLLGLGIDYDGNTILTLEYGGGPGAFDIIKVLDFNGSSWTQRGTAQLHGIDGVNHYALSSDGNSFLTAHTEYGVRVYHWDGFSWAQRGIDVGPIVSSNFFELTGADISADGRTVAFIARGYQQSSSGSSSRAYVYDFDGSAWVRRGAYIPKGSSQFYSLVLSGDGNTLLISPSPSSTTDRRGNIQKFQWDGITWAGAGGATGNINDEIGGGGAFRTLPYSISYNGDIMAYSSLINNYVQIRGSYGGNPVAETITIPQSYMIQDPDLSADGLRVAFGDYETYLDPLFNGGVYTYDYNGATWDSSYDIVSGPNGSVSSYFGSTSLLSGDGNALLVGDPIFGDNSYSGTAPLTGLIKVYGTASHVGPDPIFLGGNNTGTSPNTLNIPSCDSFTWSQNGVTYNASGLYYDTLQSSQGTDSIITLNLQLTNTPSITTQSIVTGCAGQPVTLSASGANQLLWSGGVVNDVPFIPTASGVYLVQGTNGNGCYDVETVQLDLTDGPLVSAGNDTVLCVGEPITLNAGGAQSYTWSNGQSNGSTYTPLSSESLIVSGIDASGCVGQDSINITLTSVAPVFAGNDTVVCVGSPITLSASGAVTYQWTNNVIDGVAFTPSSSTAYRVVGTVNVNCEGEDSIYVGVVDGPLLTSSVVNPTNNQNGQVDLTVNGGNPPYAFDWDYDGVGDFNDLEDQNSLSPGTYSVVVRDASGCEDELFLTLSNEGDTTGGGPGGDNSNDSNISLTPNGDGLNDAIDFDWLDNYPNSTVGVLNRWGQSMYQSDGPSASWDGTYEGEVLPPADYYYIIDLGDGSAPQTGTITLKY